MVAPPNQRKKERKRDAEKQFGERQAGDRTANVYSSSASLEEVVTGPVNRWIAQNCPECSRDLLPKFRILFISKEEALH